MVKAKDLPLSSGDWMQMDTAAMERQRIRVQGVVTAVGDGYSARYRNRWLRVHTGSVTVQVTASSGSRLGGATVGSELDLVLSLTGMVDLSAGVYFGGRAQLLDVSDCGAAE